MLDWLYDPALARHLYWPTVTNLLHIVPYPILSTN